MGSRIVHAHFPDVLKRRFTLGNAVTDKITAHDRF
jgi:hypothetical protein